MSLLRRNTNRDLAPMRELMTRLFDEPSLRPGWLGTEGFGPSSIPLDIVEEGDTLRVTASVPGVQADALHVEVDDDALRIWGETKEDKEHKEDAYYLREHRYGRVERTVRLPYAVKAEGAQAEFDNGVLTLSLPKSETARRKEIKVQTKS